MIGLLTQPVSIRGFSSVCAVVLLTAALASPSLLAQEDAAEQEEVPRIPRQTLDPADLELPEPPETGVSTAQTEDSAEEIRDRPNAYMTRFSAEIRLPAPAESWEKIAQAQPDLAVHRSWLEQLFGTDSLRTSPLFPAHYQARAQYLQRRSAVFHDLPDAAHFYDLHALLKTPSEPTGARPALLLQGDFTRRGSTQAVEEFEAEKDPTEISFDPITAYRWPRQEEDPDSDAERLLENSRSVLGDLETEYAVVGLPRKRNRALEAGIAQRERELELLPEWNYLDSVEVPFVVLPPVFRQFAGETLSPAIGDLALVLIGDHALPAIFGDETAEPARPQLSPALWKAAGQAADADDDAQPVRATLLLFPGTADPGSLKQAPDPAAIRERVARIYEELSGEPLPEAPAESSDDVPSSGG